MTYLWFALCRVLYRNLVMVQHDLLEISRLEICCAYQQKDPKNWPQSHQKKSKGLKLQPILRQIYTGNWWQLTIKFSLIEVSPSKKRFHCSAPTVSQQTAWCNKHLLPMPKGIFCYRRGFPPTSAGFDMYFLHEDEEHILLVGLGMIGGNISLPLVGWNHLQRDGKD